MSNKLTIENPLDWRSRALLAESEEERLRAEVERLQLADRQWADHVRRLSDEVERLRAALGP